MNGVASPDSGALRCDTAEVIELVSMARAAGGSVWVRANSRSMTPAIPIGANVRLDPPSRIVAGDIVLAELPNGLLVLHRVHRVTGDRIMLRGDASSVSDPPISRSRVLARAEVVVVDGSERRIPPRALVSIRDIKRWIRPVVRFVRRTWRAVAARTGA